MNPKYIQDIEFQPGFDIVRKFEFDIDYYDDKRNWYWQKIKQSNYLPKCLRDHITAKIFGEHIWVRCPYHEQVKVFPDFYKDLGIEMGPDYIFEVQNVW